MTLCATRASPSGHVFLLRHGERERLAHRRDPHVLSFWLEENLDVVAFPHRPLEQGGVESNTGGTKLDLVEPRRAPLQHGHGCSTSVAPPRQNYPATVALPKHRLPGTHPWAWRSLHGCSWTSLASQPSFSVSTFFFGLMDCHPIWMSGASEGQQPYLIS